MLKKYVLLPTLGMTLYGQVAFSFAETAQVPIKTKAESETTIAIKPLLQEGKKTLFQRVLTTPSCKISQEPKIEGQAVPAFSRFYVYEKQVIESDTWLKVGPDSYGKTSGWINANCAVDWKMQLTLAFTNPAGRNQTLFFKEQNTIEALLENSAPETELKPIYDALANSQVVEQVLAIEPSTMVDQKTQFYLLPVLASEEVFTEAGFRTRLLNVASVSKEPEAVIEKLNETELNISNSNSTSVPNATTSGNTPVETSSANLTNSQNKSETVNQPMNESSKSTEESTDPNRLSGFSASVVFVIDSTISMGPYIDKTKEVVNQIYQQIEQANMLEQVKFGLVSFRSNVEAVPGLEWNAKMFANPNQVKNGQDFLAQVSGLKEAKVSSSLYDEDPYAGVMLALETIDWNQFGARYIVLVTDAGAIEADNTLSSTGLDAAQVRQEAARRGVALYTLHLKSKSGLKNHAKAEAQYTDLAFNSYINKPLYYPIELADVSQFGQKIETLGKAITTQIQTAYQGENAIGSATQASDQSTPIENTPTPETTDDQLIADTELLGHAMRLAYLGKTEGVQAPPVFQAWISDRDIEKQTIPTVEVQVLLTKSEMSDMSDMLTKVVNAANEGLISPEDMFAELRDLAATMGKDPGQLQQSGTTNLSELGLLGEYLEDLPYLSEVLSLDEETWKSWDGLEQEKFIRRLNTKIQYYKKYNEDSDRWIALAPDSDPRDYVYPVPLENLP
ncbi:vWA domain-containing protein [Thorsellia anophelis]|uniref:VWFA domain-containing protein n=1 Tax=Thorsellia anophelis DSM 18579 TaxID=1123402 RepID=A0A1H9ZSI9_9GAMM|nr:vWA domain-containing protein [Thorsellia anophelis]SES84162.1 hypothetical protein SAMN02583745_00658 [Thorsellia anophelis DSM 18579]